MKIRVWVKTNKIGSESSTTFEIDPDEWREMTDPQRDEMARQALQNIYEWNYEAED